MLPDTFLWHDYETFGRDPARERPVQFAAIRTDSDLNQLDEMMIYCRQTADYLPDPESCLVHHVLPQTANEKGLVEREFASQIHLQMSQPGTCVAGYNNIRFDDEFTRQLFFRNLFDPYSREWRNGNTRWDLIDVVRLTRALRPEGINWPSDEDGKASNKLERLTEANGIPHGDAHDALADVRATIAVARLIKQKQPKLFDYALRLRSKQNVTQLLDLTNHTPIVHVSGMYAGAHSSLSVVIPLCQHPSNPNGVLAYDLRQDPTGLIELDTEQIAARLFTRKDDLPENTERIAIKTIHRNRCPALAPISTLTDENKAKLSLNLTEAMQYREMLLSNLTSITTKLQSVFTQQHRQNSEDPELTLYSGSFASQQDRQMMDVVHQQLTDGITGINGTDSGATDETDRVNFQDTRLNELYLRVRARNYPESLQEDDVQHWKALCHMRVHEGSEGFRSIDTYQDILQAMRARFDDQPTIELINSLQEYGQSVAAYSEL